MLLASSYISIPSSKVVLREEAFLDHSVHSKTSSLPATLLHRQLELTSLLGCRLICFPVWSVCHSARHAGRSPAALFSTVCTLTTTCSKYLLNKANEREGPHLLQLYSVQPLLLWILTFTGEQRIYNEHPKREDREHLAMC